MDLRSVIKVGNSNNKKKQNDYAQKNGFVLDNELSNDKHQVYYNKKDNKLLYNINGTQNNSLANIKRDWTTNAMILFGQGKKTDRYKEEKGNLEASKRKFNNPDTTITGYSQGGFHANLIKKPEDNLITYNTATVGGTQKGTNYRTINDPISALNIFDKNTKNITPNFISNAHSSDNIKYIPI
jgi:hypothetical protein